MGLTILTPSQNVAGGLLLVSSLSLRVHPQFVRYPLIVESRTGEVLPT